MVMDARQPLTCIDCAWAKPRRKSPFTIIHCMVKEVVGFSGRTVIISLKTLFICLRG